MVNVKKPGISLKVCNQPISDPVKLAFSTTKLFNKANQPDIAMGIAIDTRIKNPKGDWKFSLKVLAEKAGLIKDIRLIRT